MNLKCKREMCLKKMIDNKQRLSYKSIFFSYKERRRKRKKVFLSNDQKQISNNKDRVLCDFFLEGGCKKR